MPPATTAATAAQGRERLLELLTPVVAGTGHELEDVTVSAAGRRSVVRVIVDADGGVDLDAVADVSRAVSDALDAFELADAGARAVLGGAYVLEVSSPGIDRPLREPRHWRRNTGRLVAVDVDGRSRTARVTAVDADGVLLAADGPAPEHVGWDRLGPGRVQVEFNRPGAGADEEDE